MNDRIRGSKWELMDFPFRELCRNDIQKNLKIEFFEIKSVKEVEKALFVADFDFSLEYLRMHQNKFMNCFSGKLNVGKVKLMHCTIFEKKQFIDYIYGGLDISTMVAIDCCIANGHPQSESSLHKMTAWNKIQGNVGQS